MSRSTVSVVLCTYNGEKFVGRQFASILGQSRLPDEIVVSDDGSADDTVRIVHEQLAIADGLGIRAVFMTGPGRGVTANFAAAIGSSTGDIVVLSDQDDAWGMDRLRRSVAIFDRAPGVLLHHTDAFLIDSAGTRIAGSLYRTLGVRARDLAAINLGAAFSVYLRRNIATGAVMAFRRALVDVALPIPDEWVHDEWLAIMGAAHGRVLADMSRPVSYRQHGGNQIGVTERTLMYRLRRLLSDAPGRNARLAVRSTLLAERLDGSPGVPPALRVSAWRKAAFEQQRAAYPPSRVSRLGRALRLSARGDYRRFASQGDVDVIRDLTRSVPSSAGRRD